MNKTIIVCACRVVLLVALLLTATSLQYLSVLVPTAVALPENTTLTWSDDPQTTQDITWKSSSQIAGQLQYTEVKQATVPAELTTITAEVKLLSTNLGSVYINSVKLIALKPGTRYTYHVGDISGWTEPRSFVTASAQAAGIKFLVFGDSQSNNYAMWRATIQQAYQANPKAVFFSNVGDLVDVGDDYAQWKDWFDAASVVLDKIPVIPVVGNHENYTMQRIFSLPALFIAQFNLPQNGPEGLKGQVYSFDYGQVHFVILDTQEREEKQFLPQMLASQREWLEKDLAATNKKWKVIFMHRAPYDNNGSANENIREAFAPIFDKYHVDVAFTAHDHVCGRTYPLCKDKVQNDPAKGTIYVPVGRSGTKTYKHRASQYWNQFFYNPLDMPNYLTVEVQGDNFFVKVFKQNGELIDSWSVNKTIVTNSQKRSA